MKIEELRLNNYVKSNCHNGLITSIGGINQASLMLWCNPLASYNIDEVSPIELSPEILDKAGFSNTVTTREGQYVQYGLKTGSWDFMVEFYNEGEPQFYLDMVGVDIIYLHQLQNLYWCLVGKELEIHL